MGLAARPGDQAQLAMFPGVLCKRRWRSSVPERGVHWAKLPCESSCWAVAGRAPGAVDGERARG